MEKNKSYWPIDPKGQLDEKLFDHDFIQDVFYKVIPKARDCTPETVRKGLRTIQKNKGFPKNSKNNILDIAISFCSNYECRRNLQNVKIIRTKKNNFTRGPRDIQKLGRNLNSCFWLYYTAQNEYKSLVEWSMAVSDNPEFKEKPSVNTTKYFITSETLSKRFEKNPCPIDFNSIEIARIITIFASSLETAAEQLALLKQAALLGNEFLTIPNTIEEKKLTVKFKKPILYYTNLEGIEDQVPTLKNLDKNQSLKDLEKGLYSLQKNHTEIETVKELISISNRAFEKEIKKITLYREKNNDLKVKADIIKKNFNKEVQAILDCFQYPKNKILKTEILGIESLINYCTLCDQVIQKYQALKNKSSLSLNREKLLRVEDIQGLIEVIDDKSLIDQKGEAFFEYFKYYLTKSSETTSNFLTNAMQKWTLNETFIIIDKLIPNNFTPALSAMVARSFENNGHIFPEPVSFYILGNKNSTRNYLYFINPKNISKRENPEIKMRILGELIIDSFLFENSDLLLDYYDGMTDKSIFGKNINDLLALLSQDNEFCKNGRSLINAFTEQMPIEEASELVGSYLTKNYANNVYGQIESLIYQNYFSSVMNNGILSHDNVNTLFLTIRDGSLAEKILNDFSITKSHSSWGNIYNKYIEYLIRQFEIFLEEVLIRTRLQNSNFPEHKTKGLRDLLAEFTEGNLPNSGSIGELEKTVKEIFQGKFNNIHHKTLTGLEESIFERICTEDDNNWFLDFFGYALSHVEDDILLIDAAASNMEALFSKEVANDKAALDQLINEEKFSHALFIAEMASTNREAYVKKVRSAAKEKLGLCQKNFSNLKDSVVENTASWQENQKIISNAMNRLDFKLAHEQLKLVQNQEFERTEFQKIAGNEAATEQKVKHLKSLILTAGQSVDEEFSVHELEAVWTEVLRQRSKERAHLSFVEDSFSNLTSLPTGVEKRFAVFCSKILEASYWLPSSMSGDFLYSIKSAPQQLKNWLENNDAYDAENKKAVESIFFWFFDFIENKSKTMHDLDAEDDNDEYLEQLMEATYLIIDNHIPLRAYEKIIDEFPFFLDEPHHSEPIEKNHVIAKESEDDVSDTAVAAIEDEIITTETGDIDYNNIPLILKKFIQSENWEQALSYCNQNKYNDFEECLNFIKQSSTSNEIVKVSDLSAFNISNIMFNFSKFSSLISARALLTVIFDLLYNISSRDFESKKLSTANKGDWAIFFSKKSEFLSVSEYASLNDTHTNILKNIFSNKASLPACEKIWHSATNNPQAVKCRAQLILFLEHFNSMENIISLSGKFAPDLKNDMKNFLEARQASISQKDIAPVARAFGDRIVAHFNKPNPFKTFIESLPIIHQEADPKFEVEIEGELQFHEGPNGIDNLLLPITLSISNLILEKVEAVLFEDDDILFFEEARIARRRTTLAADAIYVSHEFNRYVQLGTSWSGSRSDIENRSFKLRVRGKGLSDGKFYTKDLTCQVSVLKKGSLGKAQVTEETLREFYPGIGSSVIQGKEHFHGRVDELERLEQILVARQSPSPVLVTGMRRVGKTTLLHKFHDRHGTASEGSAVTIYLSLSERKADLAHHEHSVSKVIWNAIKYPLTKNPNKKDKNLSLASRLKQMADSRGKDYKNLLKSCYEQESLADTITALSDTIIDLLGGNCKRVIILIDEAEALVSAFQSGPRKQLELDQMFHSLREVSQTSSNTGILLSGSHHINIFASDYKSAFFGSCEQLNLVGITDFDEARHLIAPSRIAAYIEYEKSAIQYAIDLCAGMPLFMWQVGALTSFLVKSGTARKGDVKRAVEIIVSDVDTFFTVTDPTFPIDTDIQVEPGLEPTFLWILLYKIAQASSLIQQNATKFIVIDQELLALDTEKAWKDRISKLIELKLIIPVNTADVKFAVPIFAHGFRAKKSYEKFRTKEQLVS